MKKTALFGFLFAIACMFASCGNGKTGVATNCSDSVMVDTIAADTVFVDSVAAPVDSVVVE